MSKPVGMIASVRRYPVKSFGGEELSRGVAGRDGLTGDRQFALIDRETGKVVSAKNPRKWPRLLDLSARWGGGELRIGLPDGASVAGDDPNRDRVLSAFLGRAVALSATPAAGATIEVNWPAVAGLPGAGTDAEERLPAGTFFDLAPIHLLTTATLTRLSELAPDGRFDPLRFRPNLVIDTGPGPGGFVEQEWVGRTLRIGDRVRLRMTAPCSRCVMTTLAQPGVPADPEVLRTAVRHAGARVGAYAAVLAAGEVGCGQPVWLD